MAMSFTIIEQKLGKCQKRMLISIRCNLLDIDILRNLILRKLIVVQYIMLKKLLVSDFDQGHHFGRKKSRV